MVIQYRPLSLEDKERLFDLLYIEEVSKYHMDLMKNPSIEYLL